MVKPLLEELISFNGTADEIEQWVKIRMATDLSVFNRDDVQTFVNLALRPPYSFPMLDFAYCVDNALPSLLTDRMIHIAEII
ncbi:unnamed protein product [Rotaria sp. Silwood1]|nr:unnamed protein product [Rotaria sp. Silwood1]CAF5019576.1 unnamed protein product [Rotaria sp. Silwood1]